MEINDSSLYVGPSRIEGRGIFTKINIRKGTIIKIRWFGGSLEDDVGFNSLVDGNIRPVPTTEVWTRETFKNRYSTWVALRNIRVGEELALGASREEISGFPNPIYTLEMPHL